MLWPLLLIARRGRAFARRQSEDRRAAHRERQEAVRRAEEEAAAGERRAEERDEAERLRLRREKEERARLEALAGETLTRLTKRLEERKDSAQAMVRDGWDDDAEAAAGLAVLTQAWLQEARQEATDQRARADHAEECYARAEKELASIARKREMEAFLADLATVPIRVLGDAAKAVTAASALGGVYLSHKARGRAGKPF